MNSMRELQPEGQGCFYGYPQVDVIQVSCRGERVQRLNNIDSVKCCVLRLSLWRLYLAMSQFLGAEDNGF